MKLILLKNGIFFFAISGIIKVLGNGGTAITKGKTPVPVCSPELSPVGRG